MLIIGYGRAAAPSSLILPNVPDSIWLAAWDLTDDATVRLNGLGRAEAVADKGPNGFDLTGNPAPEYASASHVSFTGSSSAYFLHRTAGDMASIFDASAKSLVLLLRPTGSAGQQSFVMAGLGAGSDWVGISQTNSASTFDGANFTGSTDMYLGGALIGEDGNAARNRQAVFNAIWALKDKWIVLEVRDWVPNPSLHDDFHLVYAPVLGWHARVDVAFAGICSAADAATYSAGIVAGLQAKLA